MSTTPTTAAPAQAAVTAPQSPPASPTQTPTPIDAAEAHRQEMDRLKAMTAEAQFEQGRIKGVGEGEKNALDRLNAIVAVCPGKPQMAIDAFTRGQSAESVKMAFDESAKVEAAAQQREREQSLELERWKALAATGGYPGGVAMNISNATDDSAPQIDPKVQAEQEWDHKPAVRKGFSSKDRYVAYRTAELKGQVRTQRAQPVGA